MNNGVSKTTEIEVRKHIKAAQKTLRYLVQELNEEEWDFQALEAVYSRLNQQLGYVSQSIVKGLAVLYANGEIERVAGVPISMKGLTQVQSYEELDLEPWIRELLNKKQKDILGDEENR